MPYYFMCNASITDNSYSYFFMFVLQFWLISSKLLVLSRNFSQFIEKPRLDNKAVIRYLNPNRFYDNEN